jgi:hypothetical protein
MRGPPPPLRLGRRRRRHHRPRRRRSENTVAAALLASRASFSGEKGTLQLNDCRPFSHFFAAVGAVRSV